MSTKIGSIAVDSGQIMIIDPCYINADFAKEFDHSTKGQDQESYEMNYDGCCNATLSSKGYGTIGDLAIACGTLYGDGEYPVYAELDRNGRVRALTIDFDPEEDLSDPTPDEEDLCYDYEDDDNEHWED
jgi:hypothetical protein